MGLTDKHFTEISAQNAIVQLLGRFSKISRIKGAADYTRTFTYHPTATQNVISILHQGTTFFDVEEIIETINYENPSINGSNITTIVYS